MQGMDNSWHLETMCRVFQNCLSPETYNTRWTVNSLLEHTYLHLNLLHYLLMWNVTILTCTIYLPPVVRRYTTQFFSSSSRAFSKGLPNSEWSAKSASSVTGRFQHHGLIQAEQWLILKFTISVLLQGTIKWQNYSTSCCHTQNVSLIFTAPCQSLITYRRALARSLSL